MIEIGVTVTSINNTDMFLQYKKPHTLTEISSASSEGNSTCDKPKAAGEAALEEVGVDILTDSDGAVDSG